MEETTFRMTGYHGTCSRYMESIAKNGLDPKYSHYRKDHWLGQGVYFFEDYTIAKNWAQDIAMQSRNFGSVPVVYEAQIQADKKEVLDLDNYKVAIFFCRIF